MKDDLRIHDDVATLVEDSATWLLARIAAAQAEGRRPHVALTGGSLADPLHHEVARRAVDHPADLMRVDWWWGDERFVPAESDQRNDTSAVATLLQAAGVPPGRIHRVATTDQAPSVEAAAEQYGHELRAHDVAEFEVVVLGIGPDGHVASLFPHHPQLEATRAETVAVRDSPKPPPERVSLSMSRLQHTRAVLFLAAGEGKAHAVAAARAPGPLSKCPARGPRGTVETVWSLDRGAASHLETAGP